jgi:polysaccharide export outer membrane protein
MLYRIVTTLCTVGIVVGTASAQVSEGTAPTTSRPTYEPTFVNLSGFSNDYQVGPGDMLEIEVIGHDELKQTVRISNSGEISFSLVGLIRVSDTTVFDVESTIAERLREKQLIEHADVLVRVTEYQAKPIYVSGAVARPGEFIMSQELTAADAILLAGGLQASAADEGILHRRVSPEAQTWSAESIAANPDAPKPGVEIVKIDLRPLKEGRFFEAAIPLQRGDVLIVPQLMLNSFFVVGDVVTPGHYTYPPTKVITASQAVSWAQGPNLTAKMSEGMLVRYGKDGARKEMKIDYAAVLRGRQNDFAIEPNDIIFIPGSAMKTIGQALLGTTDVMLMQQTFAWGRRAQRARIEDRVNEEILGPIRDGGR